jgi:hypothetical protein
MTEVNPSTAYQTMLLQQIATSTALDQKLNMSGSLNTSFASSNPSESSDNASLYEGVALINGSAHLHQHGEHEPSASGLQAMADSIAKSTSESPTETNAATSKSISVFNFHYYQEQRSINSITVNRQLIIQIWPPNKE